MFVGDEHANAAPRRLGINDNLSPVIGNDVDAYPKKLMTASKRLFSFLSSVSRVLYPVKASANACFFKTIFQAPPPPTSYFYVK